MIVDPDFFDHWKTVVLIEELGGDPAAPLYILRLWAHCQNRRQWVFEGMPSKAVRALCRFPGEDDKLMKALQSAGFVTVEDGTTVTVLGWDEYNAQLIANWTNGKKGGRPKKPMGNPSGTQSKPTVENGSASSQGDDLEPTPTGQSGVAVDQGKPTENAKTPCSKTHGKPMGNPSETHGEPIRLDRIGSDRIHTGKPAKSPEYPDWFESFWKAYPANSKGRKRGKEKTFKLCKPIPASEHQDLITAAEAYRSDADGYVRDPERFIKDDFWRDYVGERERPAHLPEPKKPRGPSINDMRFKLMKAGRSAARDWDDETIERQYRKMVAAPERRLPGTPQVAFKDARSRA